jgi:pantoate--beta-alanine ligase
LKTVEIISDLRQALAISPNPVGFVPTMGYLHEGHLSLVERARKESASVVVSIFVNPTQFGPNEDLDSYPRDIARDLDLLEKMGTDLVWMPTQDALYPPSYQTWVTVEQVTKPLEGIYRPGHFRGVATIVAKLFNAVQPDRAYFGQKDAQQSAAIRQMVRDLNFPLEIVVCPTIRELDGLAMSSRNVYLDPTERRAAPVLYRGLITAKNAFNDGERVAAELRRIVKQIIEVESLADIQYISCADPDTLVELEGNVERGLLSLAVRIGKTRLIDNITLGD